MRRWAVGILLVAIHGVAAEPRWIRLVSPNFEMYTSGSAGAARDTLRQFEQVRGFFFQVVHHAPAKPVPVRIVAFGSAKEYDAVRFNEFAAAYYQPTADRDFIVMSPGTTGASPTAIHEYVHLVVRHSNLTLPPWLNEGLAELYSTLSPQGDKVLVGSLIPGRQQALLQGKWVSLATILAAGQDSPYYNEKNQAGSLYNEGWALTHMLELQADYRPKFASFMAAIATGTDSAEAFRTVYGKSVAQVEKELQTYLRGDRFQAALVPAKLENFNEKLQPEPLPSFEVKLTMAELLNRPGREADTRARLQALIADDPKRPEPHAELAYLEWRGGHTDIARPEFEKAFDLGARGSRFLWDYGRLAERDGEKAFPVLQQLLAQEPDRMDARLELAEAQLRARQPAAALATLLPVHTVTKSDAPRLFRITAQAQWQAGNRDGARTAAEMLIKNAQTDRDRADAERILALLDRKPEPADTPFVPPSDTNDSAPHLRRADVSQPRDSDPPPPPPPSVEGRFEQLNCAGTQARLVIRAADRVRTLLIDDPNRISVITAGGGTVELQCGPQKNPPRVTVEYEPPPTPLAGIDGIVRAIQFHP
jgi:tetratricopeptide (TPR) repeat protein